MVTTEIGKVVFGTTAKLVVTPVFTLVNKKAKASEYKHWKFPYSSEAKIKSKLKFGEIGVKSNSKTVAFLEAMWMPAAANVFSKSVSPSQSVEPSFKRESLGPGVFKIFPVLKTTPLCIGKFGLVF